MTLGSWHGQTSLKHESTTERFFPQASDPRRSRRPDYNYISRKFSYLRRYVAEPLDQAFPYHVIFLSDTSTDFYSRVIILNLTGPLCTQLSNSTEEENEDRTVATLDSQDHTCMTVRIASATSHDSIPQLAKDSLNHYWIRFRVEGEPSLSFSLRQRSGMKQFLSEISMDHNSNGTPANVALSVRVYSLLMS